MKENLITEDRDLFSDNDSQLNGQEFIEDHNVKFDYGCCGDNYELPKFDDDDKD